MFISLNTNLIKQLTINPRKPPSEEECPAEYVWNGVKRVINGTELLFLVNWKTRFLVTMPAPKEDIDQEIKEYLTATFKSIGASEESIEKYFEAAGAFTYGTMRNGILGNWLTKGIERATRQIHYDLETTGQFGLEKTNDIINVIPFRTGYHTKIPFIPRVAMENLLEAYGSPGKTEDYPEIFEFKSTLVDSEIETERSFLISSNATFKELLDVLSELYNFSESQLYQFEIFSKERKFNPDYKVLDSRIESEEVGDDTEEISWDHKIKDYLKEAHHTVFNYDLNDNWRIKLILRRVYQGCKENDAFLPFLLTSRGPSPIEEMGGISYYNMLAAAISHPKTVQNEGYSTKDLEKCFKWAEEEDFNPTITLDVPKIIDEKS